MNIFLFPIKSAIPDNKGEKNATHKNAAAVTKLIIAVFLKLYPNNKT
jgi:hypothetical protein